MINYLKQKQGVIANEVRDSVTVWIHQEIKAWADQRPKLQEEDEATGKNGSWRKGYVFLSAKYFNHQMGYNPSPSCAK